MEMSGCQFLTAASAKKLPSRKDEGQTKIDNVDPHDAVIQFCNPAFMAIRSFMENTCVNVYHK